jgi:ATP-binding cassette subfamily F protein 3
VNICNVQHLTKYHAANRVLDNVSLEINTDSRIGLIGPNGAGKSTLLRIIAGLDESDGGQVTRKRGLNTGFLPQEPQLPDGSTVLDEALKASDYYRSMEQEMRDLESRMGDPAVYEDPDALQNVIDEHELALKALEDAGGLNVDGRVLEHLQAVGFSEDDYLLPASSLSGGQKKLLFLARILATMPDLLLLDEPDNHLDTDGKQMLERLVATYPGAVVLISHDRHMLDVTADLIAELEVFGQHPGRSQLSLFPGTYSEYANEKRLALMQQQANYELQTREISRLKSAIRRMMDWNQYVNHSKFVRRAQNMERRIERMDKIEKPILNPKRIGLEFGAERGGFKVLEIKNLQKAFGDQVILSGADLLVTHSERVALTGRNGTGKSVLFKIVTGVEPATAGEIKVGARISIGYYSQEQETLDMDLTPVDEVRKVKDMHESQAYAFLGSFLFDFHKARRKVGTLSGGEKARLQMAKLMLMEGNLLLLDEPTNNLDIPSCEALEDAIDQYDGTVLVISHDRYFLERVVTRTVELRDRRLIDVEAQLAGEIPTE